MVRPREFDEHEVLHRAVELFWEKGYEGASLCDLLEATGIARGSLYKAFGSKHGIFLMALQTYLDQGLEKLQATLYEASSVAQGIAQWLDHMAWMSVRTCGPCGCLAVNMAAELGSHDQDVRELLRLHELRMRSLYIKALSTDPDAPRTEQEAGELADFLGIFIHGLQVKGRAGLVSLEQARAMAKRVCEAMM